MGLAAWQAERLAILDTTPAAFVGADKVFSRADWKEKLRAFFLADQNVYVAAGYVGAVADIAARAAARRAQWLAEVYRVVGVTKPPASPTKVEMWALFGYQLANGHDWMLIDKGNSAGGFARHLTVSADSIRTPRSPAWVGAAAALNGTPAAIWDAIFMTVDVALRVHVTRDSNPKTHLYLGGVNGAGHAVANADWGGDAAGAHQLLADFKADILAKILTAKAAGWA